MNNKQKLELTWIGKENRPKLEPRILLEDSNMAYHATKRKTNHDLFDNRLIFGDNLLALRALEQQYAGKIKCVCIDPPYNTGSAFEHYDDGVEHSLWLTLMRDRLELLRKLMSTDGSIWIIIDDNEAHYLKVLCDEVFGRQNFFGAIAWQHSVQSKNDAKTISLHHNYVIVYRKTESFQRNRLPRTEKHNVNYSNPDNDPKGAWRSGDVRSPNLRENLRYNVVSPGGKKIRTPVKGWRWSQELFNQKVETGEITFVDNETRVLRKIYLAEQEGRVPESIWFGDEVGTTREATAELTELLPDAQVFATPKPERLINRILQIATNAGDLVLDSFAGSGTTGAVAHKMGRRWIMVELGDHCHTHIIPRMKKVIDGKDKGGITKSADWESGGGFRYYKLAPSLLEKDKWDNWVINKEYKPEMLVEAMCKLQGFTCAPSDVVYWKHGFSSERDFIYITTQSLSREKLSLLSDEVGPNQSLLICCSAFRCQSDFFPNLTLKKIPKVVMNKCEWGRDDYSLSIANLPPVPEEEDQEAPVKKGKVKKKRAKKESAEDLPLFTKKR